MEAKLAEITLSAGICERLRQLYHPHEQWGECHGQVTIRLRQLMAIARKFYCSTDDLEILKQLAKYTTDDLREAFEDGNEQSSNNSGHNETAARQANQDTGEGIKTAKA